MIEKLLDKAALVSSGIKSASDYSYSAAVKSGPHYRLVGDAAGMYYSTIVNVSANFLHSVH